MIKVAIKDARRSGFSLLVLLCMVMTIATPIVMCALSASFMNAAKEENEKVYGLFDNILYMAQEDGMPDDWQTYIDVAGIVDIFETYKDTEELVVGYVDEEAATLANIRILSGRWPEQDDEIVVCNSLAYKYKGRFDVGQVVIIGGHEWHISGLINDYSAHWNKPAASEDIFCPNIMVGASAAATGFDVYQRHYLIKNRTPFLQAFYTDYVNLKMNTNRFIGDQSGQYAVPSFVFILTSLCCVWLDFYLFLFMEEKETEKLAILRCVGLSKKNSYLYYGIKLFVILLAAIPIGIMTGYGLAFAVLQAFNRYLNTDYSPVIRLSFVIGSIGICLAANLISFLMLVLRTAGLAPVKQLKGERQSKRNNSEGKTAVKKTGLCRLVALEFGSRVSRTVVAVLLAGFSISLFLIQAVYLDVFASNMTDAPGQMSGDFDYEFITDVNDMSVDYLDASGNMISAFEKNPGDSVIYIPDHDRYFPETEIERLRNSQDIRQVKTYLEATDLYMLSAPSSEENAYLQGYILDGEIDDKIKTSCNIEGNTRNIQYFGYSEDELTDMASAAVVGDIDLDKIRKGEEAILMVPVYELATRKNGVVTQSYIPFNTYENEPAQYKDTFFHVGDEIQFVQFLAKDNFSGYMGQETIDSYLLCQRKTIKIGAIIYERVGWFDGANQLPTAYTLLGLNESFETLDIHPTGMRVRAYLKDTVSYRDFDPIIQSCAKDAEGFYFRNHAAEMDGLRKYHLLYSTVCYIMSFLSFFIVVAVAAIEEWINYHQKRNYYSILRVNGLSKLDIRVVRMIRSLIVALMGIACGVIISCLLCLFIWGGSTMLSDYVDLAGLALPIGVLGMLMTFMPMVAMRMPGRIADEWRL